jgi:hypothetical protein
VEDIIVASAATVDHQQTRRQSRGEREGMPETQRSGAGVARRDHERALARSQRGSASLLGLVVGLFCVHAVLCRCTSSFASAHQTHSTAADSA